MDHFIRAPESDFESESGRSFFHSTAGVPLNAVFFAIILIAALVAGDRELTWDAVAGRYREAYMSVVPRRGDD